MTDFLKMAVANARAEFSRPSLLWTESDDERQERERRERSKRIVDQEIQAWLDRQERQEGKR